LEAAGRMEPREETQLGSVLICDAFKMSAGCGGDENGRRGGMSSLQQQVRRRFMITDILSSAAAAAAVVDSAGTNKVEHSDLADTKPAALDMRLLFPHLPLGGLTERPDIETDTDNEGEEDGETDIDRGTVYSVYSIIFKIALLYIVLTFTFYIYFLINRLK
jgi:hypothetical protein